MQENERCPLDARVDSLEEPTEEDVPGNLYEFYLLLQTLKAGGTSFDQFLERATTWAKLRTARNQQH